MSGDEKQEQNLAVDARLDEIAPHPAVEAEIDEGRERPDFFFLDEAADHAGGEAEKHVERQRQIFVVQEGWTGQDSAAQHGPAGTDQKAEKNDGLKRNSAARKFGTQNRTQTPSVSGTRKKASKARSARGGAARQRTAAGTW